MRENCVFVLGRGVKRGGGTAGVGLKHQAWSLGYRVPLGLFRFTARGQTTHGVIQLSARWHSRTSFDDTIIEHGTMFDDYYQILIKDKLREGWRGILGNEPKKSKCVKDVRRRGLDRKNREQNEVRENASVLGRGKETTFHSLRKEARRVLISLKLRY